MAGKYKHVDLSLACGEGAGRLVEGEHKHVYIIASSECCDFRWFRVPPNKTSIYNDTTSGQGGARESEFCRQL